MPYRFRRHESVEEGVRRIALEQIDKAIQELCDEGLDSETVVHQFRKRTKKIRALLRLARSSFENDFPFENHFYRDLARRCATARDADVLVQTTQSLGDIASSPEQSAAVEYVVERLERRRHRLVETQADMDQLRLEIAQELDMGRERIHAWELDEGGFSAIAGGLHRAYQRGQKSLRKSRKSLADERLHDWRKRTKDQWYHLRLLRNVWKPICRARIRELKTLTDIQGLEHDVAVLWQTLVEEQYQEDAERELKILDELIHWRRSELQRQAFRTGARIFAESPREFLDRFRIYWKAWRTS